MKISEVVKVFCEKYPEPDKQKLFVGVLQHQQWDFEKDIRDYMMHIIENTASWLNDALPGYKTYNSKRKLLSGLNALFMIDDIKTHIGLETVGRVQTAVSTTLKADKNQLSVHEDTQNNGSIKTIDTETESETETDTESEVESETDSDEQDSPNVDVQEQQLQLCKDVLTKITAENIRLKKKIDTLKDIAITFLSDFQIGGESYKKIIEALCDYTIT